MRVWTTGGARSRKHVAICEWQTMGGKSEKWCTRGGCINRSATDNIGTEFGARGQSRSADDRAKAFFWVFREIHGKCSRPISGRLRRGLDAKGCFWREKIEVREHCFDTQNASLEHRTGCCELYNLPFRTISVICASIVSVWIIMAYMYFQTLTLSRQSRNVCVCVFAWSSFSAKSSAPSPFFRVHEKSKKG